MLATLLFSAVGPAGSHTTGGAAAPPVPGARMSTTNGPQYALAGSMVPGTNHASPTVAGEPTPSNTTGRTPSPWNASGWYDIGASSSTSPGDSAGTTFAYDPVLRGDLFFGGSSSSVYGPFTNQTWLFNATGWHQLAPYRSPPIVEQESMAWDAADNEMILFGGAANGGALGVNTTWAFANGTWTNVSGPIAPPRMYWESLFSDGDDGSVILFGGLVTPPVGNQYYSNATWQFAGGHWRNLTEVSAPSGREGVAVSWDSAADEGILFGGYSYLAESGSRYWADVWGFSHGKWSVLTMPAVPPARAWAVLSDDRALGGVVLFGGVDASETLTNDTWVYTAGNWTQFISSPAPVPAAAPPVGMTTGPDGASLAMFAIYETGPVNFVAMTWEFSTLQPNITSLPSVQDGEQPLALSVSVVGTTVAQNCSWIFGDGTTGNGSLVTHRFPGPGSYLVTVTITDQSGRVANTSRAVAVYPGLQLAATLAPPVGVAPLAVRFYGSLSGGDPPYSLGWSSPTIPDLGGASGTLAIELPGRYWLTFSGTDSGNYSVHRAFLVTVLPSPGPTSLNAAIATNVSTGPAPLDVAFAGVASGGAPPYAFAWEFADGFDVTGGTVARTFSTPGWVDASLTITDATGSVAAASAMVLVTPAFSVTAVGVAPPLNGTVAFSGSGFNGVPPYSFYWEWGDGSASTGAGVRHTYPRSGTYGMELTGVDAVGHSAAFGINVSVVVPNTTGRGGSPPPVGASLELAAFAVTSAAVGAITGGAVVMLRRRRHRDSRSLPRSRGPPRPPGRRRPPPDAG